MKLKIWLATLLLSYLLGGRIWNCWWENVFGPRIPLNTALGTGRICGWTTVNRWSWPHGYFPQLAPVDPRWTPL